MRLIKNLIAGVNVWTFVAALALLSLIGLSWTALRQEAELHHANLRGQVADVVHEIAHTIGRKLDSADVVADQLVRAAGGAARPPQDRVAEAEAALRAHNPRVTRVAIDLVGADATTTAPDGSVYRPGEVVLEGPVTLPDGGDGVALHHPFFAPPDPGGAPRLLGVITFTLPEAELLALPEDSGGAAGPLMVGLRVTGADGADIFGTVAPPEAAPVIQTIRLPGQTWEIVASPRAGWPGLVHRYDGVLVLVFVLAVSTVAGIGGTHFLFHQRDRFHKILANAVESLDVGFVLFDEKDRLQICNAEFRDHLGFDGRYLVPGTGYDTILQQTGEFIASRADTETARDWVAQRMTDHAGGQEFVIEGPDETWLKISETRTPDGFSAAVVTDITDQKKGQLLAEAANRQKTEFLSNVTHELRTPLTVIGGYAQLLSDNWLLPQRVDLMDLMDDCEKGDAAMRERVAECRETVLDYDTAVKEYSGKIAGSARHMLAMINDLLDWTRLEREAVELDRDYVDVAGFVTAALADMHPLAEAKGLELTGAHDDCVVLADVRRLRQVLFNLVGNAVRFTENGRIRIEARLRGERLVLSVEDTGCGIPGPELDRIFERFHRVDNSDTREHGGFGIGLSIVREIVTRHGGSITVESRLGEGSRFTVELPDASVAVPDRDRMVCRS
ncbi:sensor histidine kinase [Marinibacterium profundimaris]|uniref:histidine kinase n=1 Tax=Marinibacterium profundimaris TaxID=1679460 RepID=A0A225NK89_9RHOB|nr:ATP-binding protein [Marinibacterium profundimaris]OWU72641.1 hypothetical protein ATO3_16420 [Marinibacterium profundimaris]